MRPSQELTLSYRIHVGYARGMYELRQRRLIEISPAIQALMAKRPVFDAHVDSIERALDLGHDLGVRGPGHLDLVRGREGGLGAVVFVCWVNPSRFNVDHFERARAMLEALHTLAAAHPELVRVVRDGKELESANKAGLTAAIAGIEGGHAIEGSLEKLRWFQSRGLRLMTLVWNNHLPWIRSCQDGAGPDVPAGLSAFGCEIVREMNRLGIVVDLSHAAPRSFFDALEVSESPPIASHSGCASLHDHPRNLTDEQLRELAGAGGVVGIAFHPVFLDAEARREEERIRRSASYRTAPGDHPMEQFVARQEVMRSEARPLPIERVVDHIVHAIDVAGIEHVGLGSDFDGIDRGPEGLEDASCYPALAELLSRRGFEIGEIELLLGGNFRRLFSDVTKGR